MSTRFVRGLLAFSCCWLSASFLVGPFYRFEFVWASAVLFWLGYEQFRQWCLLGPRKGVE